MMEPSVDEEEVWLIFKGKWETHNLKKKHSFYDS